MESASGPDSSGLPLSRVMDVRIDANDSAVPGEACCVMSHDLHKREEPVRLVTVLMSADGTAEEHNAALEELEARVPHIALGEGQVFRRH